MRKNSSVLVALWLAVFVVGTSEYLVAGLLPEVAGDLRVPVGTAGQAVTAYALGVVASGPLVTAATVRLPRRGVALGLLLLFAAGNAVSALAPSFEVLLIGRVVASLSHAAFLALALLITTAVVPAERAGSAIGAISSGFAAATLLGVPLGSLLGQAAGWRTPFAVVAVLAVAAVGALAAVLPRQDGRAASVRAELRAVVRRPVLLVVLTTAVGFSGVSTVFTYIAPLLTGVTGFGPGAVSALLLVYGAGGLLGTFAAGRLTDLAPTATVRGVFAGLAGVLAVMPFALVWKPSAVVAVLALGLLATATIAPLQGLLLRHAGAAPTLATAVNVGAFNLGAATGSMLGGAIVAAGGLRWTAAAGALLSLTGLLLSYLAVPREAAPPSGTASEPVPAARP